MRQLPDAEQGVVITAGLGNLVAVERAGTESKEFGAYLLGEVDVPALEMTMMAAGLPKGVAPDTTPAELAEPINDLQRSLMIFANSAR